MTSTSVRRSVIGVVALFAAALPPAQEKPRDPMVATVERPAVFGRDRFGAFVPAGARALTLRVAEYAPPERGTVMVVVSLRHAASGEVREIGRFGIFPDQAFRATRPDEYQRFRFPLAEADLAFLRDPSVTLTVSLDPAGGTGAGARLAVDCVR